jgi:ADP-ribosylglycohydrolase
MKINYAKQSLEGLWVGDCIGNLGQLYYCHDILKALEKGMAKYGGMLDQFQNQFQYSDDTEEGIVLYNHFITNKGKINQDKLAMEFATRYMTRDPDGEIYGYGLNTRKVLKDIYEGKPWKEANKFIPRGEGIASHIDKLVEGLSDGKGFHETMEGVNTEIKKLNEGIKNQVRQGSCGNGSAMRIAPLGAYYGSQFSEDPYVCIIPPEQVAEQSKLSAEPTHDHPEGVAGAIATALASYFLLAKPNIIDILDYWSDSFNDDGYTKDDIGKVFLEYVIKYTPDSEVKNGLRKAQSIPYDIPVGKVIQVLGNGTHVTCQDTVPFCCYMVSKALCRVPRAEMYEKAIIETSMGFGDVDTNCAIVGGIISTVSPAPEKWIKFCQPMEGVL